MHLSRKLNVRVALTRNLSAHLETARWTASPIAVDPHWPPPCHHICFLSVARTAYRHCFHSATADGGYSRWAWPPLAGRGLAGISVGSSFSSVSAPHSPAPLPQSSKERQPHGWIWGRGGNRDLGHSPKSPMIPALIFSFFLGT